MPHSLQDAPTVHLPITAIPRAAVHRRATRIDGLERADAIVRGQSGESGASRAQRLLPGQSVPGARGGQLLGHTGRWAQPVPASAMMRAPVAESTSTLSERLQRRRVHALDPNQPFESPRFQLPVRESSSCRPRTLADGTSTAKAIHAAFGANGPTSKCRGALQTAWKLSSNPRFNAVKWGSRCA